MDQLALTAATDPSLPLAGGPQLLPRVEQDGRLDVAVQRLLLFLFLQLVKIDDVALRHSSLILTEPVTVVSPSLRGS